MRAGQVYEVSDAWRNVVLATVPGVDGGPSLVPAAAPTDPVPPAPPPLEAPPAPVPAATPPRRGRR